MKRSVPSAAISKRSVQRKVLGHILANFRHRHPDRNLTVLCLPGSSGWDIRYFQQHPQVTRLVAIEQDPDIAASLRSRFPDVEVFTGASVDLFATTDIKFDILYLDYCSHFNALVEFDIRLIFRRQLLNTKGKLVINLLGARESDLDQQRLRVLFEDLAVRVDPGESWDNLTSERQRVVAFNALIASFRFNPIRCSLPQGHPDRLYASTSAPSWVRYRTNSNHMLTGSFTLNVYDRKTTRDDAIAYAMDKWFVRGRYSIRTTSTNHLAAISRMDGVETARSWYIDRILEFYEKHGFTPTPMEIGKSYIRDWRDLVRASGLCPRTEATPDEIAAECARIAAREGYVTWDLMVRAKIARRPLFDKGRKAIVSFMDKRGIPHNLLTAPMVERARTRASRLKAWISYLESGRPKTEFKGYSWVNKYGFASYEKAVRTLRAFESDVAKGLYEDVEPCSDYKTPNS